MRFGDAVNIAELRAIAKRRLPRFVFDYVDGGSEDERTLAGNRDAYARLRFAPKTLVDVSKRDLSAQMLGAPSRFPFVVGPTGLNGLSWRNGDMELAKAASRAGVPFAMSTVSMSLAEDIAREAPGRLWLQAYVFTERRISDAIMDRALAAGFECVILTSDFPVSGKRERDIRNGLTRPSFPLATKLDILMHPHWLATVATNRPRFVNIERELRPGQDANDFVMKDMFDPSLDWDDLKYFRERWPKKLLLKGVLRADDAVRAVAIGVDGLVLSNHGGRQLDGAISGVEALPDVARAVGDRASLFVDGGVRRGSDIAKAVALGAEGVLLGRAPVYGLAAGGGPGVTRALDILTDELDRAVALNGCARVADLSPDLIVRA